MSRELRLELAIRAAAVHLAVVRIGEGDIMRTIRFWRRHGLTPNTIDVIRRQFARIA